MSLTNAQNVQFGNLPVSVQARLWYMDGAWRNGFNVNPYDDMDIETFYQQYKKHAEMYDSIFTWLASIDPVKLEPGSAVVKWSHAYANVQDADLRAPEFLQWEQHRKHIDLQWDATGCERYGLSRSPEAMTPKNEYNETKDVQNFTIKKAPSAEQYRVLDSSPATFFLFFPGDFHEPSGVGRQPQRVRKIVVKIEYFE